MVDDVLREAEDLLSSDMNLEKFALLIEKMVYLRPKWEKMGYSQRHRLCGLEDSLEDLIESNPEIF